MNGIFCPSVMLGSAVRKMICSKRLRASPKNYYGNTTPSMASSHHWKNVCRNIAGSWPNWAQDFTRTSQKNNRTSQKDNYQHSRNFWNFLIITYHSYWESENVSTYYTSKQMYNWMKWLQLLRAWHFIAATAIKPPKAACQFAADDILLYELCYNNPMDLLHHLGKDKEESSPLQYHIKFLQYQDITRRVC